MRAPDISTYKLHILRACAHLNNDNDRTIGLDIVESVRAGKNDDVNPPPVYKNLDELVEKGYVEKSEIDGRTNRYEITDAGVAVLAEWAEYLRSSIRETAE